MIVVLCTYRFQFLFVLLVSTVLFYLELNGSKTLRRMLQVAYSLFGSCCPVSPTQPKVPGGKSSGMDMTVYDLGWSTAEDVCQAW